jgi:hypothetical protein
MRSAAVVLLSRIRAARPVGRWSAIYAREQTGRTALCAAARRAMPAWLPSVLGHGHPRMQVLQYMGDRQSRAPLAELGRALLAAALADALVRDELFCQVGRII